MASSIDELPKHKATCTTRKHGTVVIDRDHHRWIAPDIDTCDFDGNFVFYAKENYLVSLLKQNSIKYKLG